MIIDRYQDTAALRRLWKQAFGDEDGFLDDFFGAAFSPDRCRGLTVNGQLAAALYWFDCTYDGQRLAYLYAIATDETFQKQGLCKALMENTHRHLRELGYVGAILVPAKESLFAFYKRLGYRICGYVTEFTAKADEPIKLNKIDAAEYARLRRLYLPENGVVQEGPLLDFLQTQAQFYAGDGFVLCAAMDSGRLIVPELLGNSSHASAIAAALGASAGRFRVPGNGKPFAMYYPLSRSAAVPSHFGLALD